MRCPFYVKDNPHHCSIYVVRSQVCRGFKCCLSNKEIDVNKKRCNVKAYYNKYDLEHNTYNQSLISLHNLFYGNYKYELQVLYCMAKCDEDTFKFLLTDTFTKYKM